MDLIALAIALISLVAAVGNGGYLALLGNAAGKRAGTSEVSTYVKGKAPVAAGAGVAALLALALALSGGVPVLAIVLGIAGAGVAGAQLQTTRARYATQR